MVHNFMTLIEKDVLQQIDQNSFGPTNIAEQFSFLPEVFRFLQKREQILGKTRPVVTYSVAITIWALRLSGNVPSRQIAPGWQESVWERLSGGEGGEQVYELLEKAEPNMWEFFLQLIEAASLSEEWSSQEVAVASLVYGTVLIICLIIFWPEERIGDLNDLLEKLGMEWDLY